MDMSSELVHAVLPVFLTAVLGAVGADRRHHRGRRRGHRVDLEAALGRRCPTASRGASRWYCSATGSRRSPSRCSRSPTARSAWSRRASSTASARASAARRATRWSPTSTPPELRGAAYGLRQALDTVGRGPRSAAGDAASCGCGPTTSARCCGSRSCRRRSPWRCWPSPSTNRTRPRAPHPPAPMRAVGAPRWRLPPRTGAWSRWRRCSRWRACREAFLVLRAQEIGLTLLWVPLVMIVMSAVYALAAYPAGLLAGALRPPLRCWPRRWRAGRGAGRAGAAAGTGRACGSAPALWGLHMGLSQGRLAAAVADVAPAAQPRHRVRRVPFRHRPVPARQRRGSRLAVDALRQRSGLRVRRRVGRAGAGAARDHPPAAGVSEPCLAASRRCPATARDRPVVPCLRASSPTTPAP